MVNKTLYHCESDQIVTEVSERACDISLFGGVQKPTGHDPSWEALDVPVWAQLFKEMTSRSPFQAQPFCVCEIKRITSDEEKRDIKLKQNKTANKMHKHITATKWLGQMKKNRNFPEVNLKF